MLTKFSGVAPLATGIPSSLAASRSAPLHPDRREHDAFQLRCRKHHLARARVQVRENRYRAAAVAFGPAFGRIGHEPSPARFRPAQDFDTLRSERPGDVVEQLVHPAVAAYVHYGALHTGPIAA
jgi:hypothetical protein